MALANNCVDSPRNPPSLELILFSQATKRCQGRCTVGTLSHILDGGPVDVLLGPVEHDGDVLAALLVVDGEECTPLYVVQAIIQVFEGSFRHCPFFFIL